MESNLKRLLKVACPALTYMSTRCSSAIEALQFKAGQDGEMYFTSHPKTAVPPAQRTSS